MEEEKKEPLTLESFMEQMYGVKLKDRKPWTPEYREAVRKKLEDHGRRRRERSDKRDPPSGPKDT